MWDYDKLFAEGNVVGFKNEASGRFGIYQITKDKELPRDAQYYSFGKRWDDYKNANLARSVIFIQYIVRLDEHGNVVEKLFDREKDILKPMPKLEDGMFVKCYSSYRNESSFGLIYNNRVVYQNGEWDEIYDLTEDVVIEVYSAEALCFDSCQETYLLWHNPKY